MHDLISPLGIDAGILLRAGWRGGGGGLRGGGGALTGRVL
eukprot:SAG31_NODE_4494_length_3187_cov_13.919365_1_plen_39_part_10